LKAPKGGRPPPHFLFSAILSKRLSANEVLLKESHCERQLCLGFIRRVLGGFLEGSRHVLGRTSARSRQNFASAGDEKDVPLESPKRFDRMYHLSLLILEPKGAKRRQKEAQRQPKGAKREAKGSPGGGKTASKTIKNLRRRNNVTADH